MLAVLAACGRTAGNDAPPCAIRGREPTSIASADAQGFPVSEALESLLAQRQGEGQRVWASLPPSLWTQTGHTPPSDRSGEARLKVEAASAERVLYEPAPAWNELGCPTESVDVSLSVTLSLPDTGASVGATGVLRVEKPSGRLSSLSYVSAALDFDGWEPAHGCALSPASSEVDAIRCELVPIGATTRCLDGQDRVAPGQLGVDYAALAERLNAQSPLLLGCGDGRSLDFEFRVEAPDEICSGRNTAPHVLWATSNALALSEAPLAATLITTDRGAEGITTIVTAPLHFDDELVFLRMSESEAGVAEASISERGAAGPGVLCSSFE